LFAELRFSAPVDVGAAAILPTDKEGRILQAGETTRRSAGAVFAQPRPDVVRTVTYNTANLDIHGNVSHAEHHFISWLVGQTSLLPQIRWMMLNLQDFSPCATCTDELISLIRQIQTSRGQAFTRGQAILTWVKPYPGIGGVNRTTRAGVDGLIGAGWKVHAPPVQEGDPLRDTQIIIVAPDYRPPT
jgi:hypothetical protein